MLRFAINILRNEADAQEVVSQVSERLWRQRERLLSQGSATTFAMTAVRNGCYDHARYRQRHHNEEPTERLSNNEPSIESRDTIELVRLAISWLPERQREILHLKDIEGFSSGEIAKIFDIEENNVRMILSRARSALRDIIIGLNQRVTKETRA